jgi:hypothetical protein
MVTETKSSRIRSCKPKTSDHRRGMHWFSSLAGVLEKQIASDTEILCDERLNLQHTVQLYGVFVETGDNRYLSLTEDFLQHCLTTTAAPSPAAA